MSGDKMNTIKNSYIGELVVIQPASAHFISVDNLVPDDQIPFYLTFVSDDDETVDQLLEKGYEDISAYYKSILGKVITSVWSSRDIDGIVCLTGELATIDKCVYLANAMGAPLDEIIEPTDLLVFLLWLDKFFVPSETQTD
jgi:hypothetical protein